MKKHFFHTLSLAAILLFMGQGCVSIRNNDAAGNGPAGVFVSTDRGESWQGISSYPTTEGVKDISAASVYRLVQDPQDVHGLYWATRAQGFFYSYDDGKTWQRPGESVNTGFIYSIAVHPADKCTIYASTGNMVYRSTDCNRTWAQVYQENENDTLRSVVINPFSPHQIFIMKQRGDILMSSDAGISWELVTYFQDGGLSDMFADPLVQGRYYVATQEEGMFRSTNFGKTWESLEEGLSGFSGGLEYRRFLVYPSRKDLLYYVSTYGIHRSEDGGTTWEALELIHPPGSARIYGFDVNPQNEKELYYTATINDRSTFYKSIDGGQSWITKKLPTDQIPTALQIHPKEQSWVYLGFTIPPSQ